MTVYVDDMKRPARPVGYRGPGTPLWSHLLADTHDELEAFARELGLAASWLQHPGRATEHYDVTNSVRERALRLGAVSIRYGRCAAYLTMRKAAEACGDVADAARCDALFRAELEADAGQLFGDVRG